MGIEEWEIEYDRSAGLRIFRELCYKHFEQSSLAQYIKAEHGHTLARLELEIDIGELEGHSLTDDAGTENAYNYLIHSLATPSDQEVFYGISRSTWIKPAVLDYFTQESKTSYYSIYHELPLRLQNDPEVIQAAIKSLRHNLSAIDRNLLHEHGGAVLQEAPQKFISYLRLDLPDPAFIASLLMKNPHLYRAIAQGQEKGGLPEQWDQLRDKINIELEKLKCPALPEPRRSLIQRAKAIMSDKFLDSLDLN